MGSSSVVGHSLPFSPLERISSKEAILGPWRFPEYFPPPETQRARQASPGELLGAILAAI